MTASVTATHDVQYNVISLLYHTLQEADTLQQYIDDARSSGDDAAAQFFMQVQADDRDRAQQAKDLLRNQMMG
ncbi:hypothetical protein KIF24_24590 [Micromonospora sp. Llam7]|uniref:hypothetical protein n=1 Tax=Micromonospora tarapacensis TaxID=2835305 RepID=UPI001C836574|nr:hypothetical protein [Micromonospora tarapacensis]MBX7268892.1 hypothetical protein [Micromonospora tarapacensis]